MKIALCTLVLNEMEWLPKLYSQHKDWPNLIKWVFVESADKAYAEANPHLVNHHGLSVDGTTEFLSNLAKTDERIIHIPFGFSSNSNVAQGKCESRQQYLNAINPIEPDFLIVVDADEFYTQFDQMRINRYLSSDTGHNAFIFRHRDIWRPSSISKEPLFSYEVRGGFWDIPYCRCWRWFPRLEYSTNHNTPSLNGIGLDTNLKRFDKIVGNLPEFIHMGFACNPKIMAAKNRYYVQRGEGKTDHRQWYV